MTFSLSKAVQVEEVVVLLHAPRYIAHFLCTLSAIQAKQRSKKGTNSNANRGSEVSLRRELVLLERQGRSIEAQLRWCLANKAAVQVSSSSEEEAGHSYHEEGSVNDSDASGETGEAHKNIDISE